MDDFVTCVVSFLMGGSKLQREPIDVNLEDTTSMKEDDPAAYQPSFSIKKGFTRLQLVIVKYFLMDFVDYNGCDTQASNVAFKDTTS